jgi:Fe-S-cluster-containing hydrogenase component 2
VRKFLSVNPDICIGCRLCELACAMSKENVFNPKKARIKVDMIGFPEVPVPVFSRLCDSCAGKPQCLKYCPVGCITFIEGNPKPDQKNIVLTEIVAEDWLQRNTGTKEEDNADNT